MHISAYSLGSQSRWAVLAPSECELCGTMKLQAGCGTFRDLGALCVQFSGLHKELVPSWG